MGRARKAWLPGGSGKRTDRGRTLPGYYAIWNEYPPGRPPVRRSRHFNRQADARAFVKRHNALDELGALNRVVPIDFRTAADEFRAGYAASSRTKATITEYMITLGLFAARHHATEVGQIGPREVEAFIASRKAAGNSEATIAKHWRNLRRFFNWALKAGYHDTNPLQHVTAPPKQKHVRRKPNLTDEELERLIAACDTDDRRLAVQLAVMTGLDRRVIEDLRVDQLRDGGVIHATRRKTGAKLTIVLPDAIAPALAALCDQKQPSDPVFQGLFRRSSHWDKPGQPSVDWWRRATEAAELQGLKFVDLRAVASRRMAAVIGDADAALMMGHSPAVAVTHYRPDDPAIAERLRSRPVPGLPSAPPPTQS